VREPLADVKVRKRRPQDYYHALPHGADPHHVFVTETPVQKVNDDDVPEQPQNQVSHFSGLGVVLYAAVSKNFCD
jgi:heat shock protein HspQ